MGKRENLEKITSQKEFKEGFIEGFVQPSKLPYNIGSIELDKDETATLPKKVGRITGSIFGGASLIIQSGFYTYAAYKGIPEFLFLPTGISAYNYFRKK